MRCLQRPSPLRDAAAGLGGGRWENIHFSPVFLQREILGEQSAQRTLKSMNKSANYLCFVFSLLCHCSAFWMNSLLTVFCHRKHFFDSLHHSYIFNRPIPSGDFMQKKEYIWLKNPNHLLVLKGIEEHRPPAPLPCCRTTDGPRGCADNATPSERLLGEGTERAMRRQRGGTGGVEPEGEPRRRPGERGVRVQRLGGAAANSASLERRRRGALSDRAGTRRAPAPGRRAPARSPPRPSAACSCPRPPAAPTPG